MVEITNVKVYDLKESVIACRNAMRTEPAEYTDEEFEKSLERAIKLAKSPSNSGHCNFLKGIRVSYDIKYPNYFSPELQRYGFNDIVCSASKMHRLMAMDLDKCCNKYVTQAHIDGLQLHIDRYNSLAQWDDATLNQGICIHFRDGSFIKAKGREEILYHVFMFIISNCPQGIELFMRCSTNYMQLRTIYHQRKNHKLKADWGAFCKFIEELPYFNEFINPKPVSSQKGVYMILLNVREYDSLEDGEWQHIYISTDREKAMRKFYEIIQEARQEGKEYSKDYEEAEEQKKNEFQYYLGKWCYTYKLVEKEID